MPRHRAGPNDDLLHEVRAIRAEIRQAAVASMQAQFVTARPQESRVTTLAQQLNKVRPPAAPARRRAPAACREESQ